MCLKDTKNIAGFKFYVTPLGSNKLVIHKIATLPDVIRLGIIIKGHKFIDFACDQLLSEFFGNEDLPLWIMKNLCAKILSSDWFKL